MDWTTKISDKARAQVRFARVYVTQHQEAGIPGHYMVLTIGELARLLDKLTAEAEAVAGEAPEEDIPFFEEPAAAEQAGAPTIKFALEGAVTDKQIKAIYAIGRNIKRLSESEVEDRCAEVFGVPPSELTKAEASQFIDVLKDEQAG